MLLFTTLLLVSSAAPPASADELRVRIDAYLSAIDTPIAAEQWRALGPEAAVTLEAIVRDGQALPSRRARAVGALAVLAAPGARALLTELTAPGRPMPVRLAAVRGLAQVTPVAELEVSLRPLLERADDPRVRAVAAEQLAAKAPARTCAAVRAQVAREDTARRPSFRRALAACGVGASSPER